MSEDKSYENLVSKLRGIDRYDFEVEHEDDEYVINEIYSEFGEYIKHEDLMQIIEKQ